MNPTERFKAIKTKIDAYITKAVDLEIQSYLRRWTSEQLKTIAHDFLAQELEKYLTTHLNSSIEDSLDALECVFEPPEDSALHTEEPFRDVFGRSEDEEEEEEEESCEDKVLECIKKYQIEHNTTRHPSNREFSKKIGVKSLKLMAAYSLLRDQGRIRGPEKKGRYSHIHIL